MPRDVLNRPVRDLRISVTDRCNYRCHYCMPLEQYDWLRRREILTFEEIARLARLFAEEGVEKIRLTGGEPLVRSRVEFLVGLLAGIDGIRDLCLTTNASLLTDQAAALRDAGLKRINVSLDTLDPDRFRRVTRKGDLDCVLRGIQAADDVGLYPIKINMVVERGVNDDEIVDMARFCRENGLSVRFVEYMDVGNTNAWKLDKVVPAAEILAILRRSFTLREIRRTHPSETALRFVFADHPSELGIIASVTRPFCGDCSRIRLTADGRAVTCLFSDNGTDLKALMRGGATDAEIRSLIASIWKRRKDRFSEERLDALRSSSGYDPTLRKKIEMITLGG